MKTIYYFSILLAVSSLNCEKEMTQFLPCADSSRIISEFSDRTGAIDFNQNLGIYSVSYHIPNSIDSVDIGIFCNLPEEFKKQGLKIQYSGNYKELKTQPGLVPAGYEYYSLELTRLKIVPD